MEGRRRRQRPRRERSTISITAAAASGFPDAVVIPCAVSRRASKSTNDTLPISIEERIKCQGACPLLEPV